MKIFKIIMYIMAFTSLAYSMICGGYLALPEEVKAMIPEFNWMTALVTGGTTSVFGTTLLVVDNFLRKSKTETESKYSQLATNYIELRDVVKNVIGGQDKIITQNALLNSTLIHLNRKIDVDLKSKLSNPLIDIKVKEMIEGVINNE